MISTVSDKNISVLHFDFSRYVKNSQDFKSLKKLSLPHTADLHLASRREKEKLKYGVVGRWSERGTSEERLQEFTESQIEIDFQRIAVRGGIKLERLRLKKENTTTDVQLARKNTEEHQAAEEPKSRERAMQLKLLNIMTVRCGCCKTQTNITPYRTRDESDLLKIWNWIPSSVLSYWQLFTVEENCWSDERELTKELLV